MNKNNLRLVITLFSILLLIRCSENPNKIRYLALGDSYTIGEGLEVKNRWPNQLANRLEKSFNYSVNLKIIAKTGYTSRELLDEIDKKSLTNNYDYVSILIGVNNQYRGLDIVEFEEELNILLDKSISFANGKRDKVFVLSIPDWGVTPFGENRDRAMISKEIDEYNSVVSKVSANKGLKYYDITDISRKVEVIEGLVASDGLHPSALMYSMWVDKVISFFIKNI
ncbi:MAG: SGNH/GDSL hydrolase family protein [Flavobacteriaceae bacterium]|nr:SGNH/GDSL hydrolase family protein [Flavobacteriaceae bacterium]